MAATAMPAFRLGLARFFSDQPHALQFGLGGFFNAKVRLLRVQTALQVTEQINNIVKVVNLEFQGLPRPFAASIRRFPSG